MTELHGRIEIGSVGIGEAIVFKPGTSLNAQLNALNPKPSQAEKAALVRAITDQIGPVLRVVK